MGTTRGADGVAIGGISVQALILDDELSFGRVVATTTTDSAGLYRFDELEPGRYTFGYRHAGYLPDPTVSSLVEVTAGAVVTGVDRTMYRKTLVQIIAPCTACDGPVDENDFWLGVQRETVVDGVSTWDSGYGEWARWHPDTKQLTSQINYTLVLPGRYRAVVSSQGRMIYSEPSETRELVDGGTLVFEVPWQFATFTRDFSGDYRADQLATTASGALVMYYGTGWGGWSAQRTIGSGWSTMTAVVQVGNFDDYAPSDLIARDAKGSLFLYPGNGLSGFKPRKLIGSGWNAFTAIVGPGDFDGDHNVDVIARTSSGALYLYPGNGSGGWLPRKLIGSGWNAFTAIVGPGDFDGDKKVDLMARASNGALYLYPGNGSGGWLPRKQIGSGWQSLRMVG